MVSKTIKIGSYIIIGVFLVIVFRLWQLQIMDGSKFKSLSENNRLRIIKTPAPRGIIYDRNNIPLVKNIPAFSVSIVLDHDRLVDMDALAALLGLKKEEIEEKLGKKNNSSFIPVKLKHGLNFEEIARIEARKSDFPGLFVETETGREYVFGKVGAHIIGHLGKINPSQATNYDLRHFPPDALIGQGGVESLFDSELRGIPGERIIEVNATGRELRKIKERQPIKGRDVTISIDINIQKSVEDAFGAKAGALVAVNPNSGEILAIESLPSFDPNIFSNGIRHKDWKEIIDNKKNPMLNRAIQSQYPPASTFKIITAVAALEEGVIDPKTRINCTGGIGYGKWSFGCWKKHGSVDMHNAIVESCDVYFYEVGKRLGIDKIYKYASAFGLGKKTGIDIMNSSEKKGFIPNTEWKQAKKGQPWYIGETFIASIGQGYITATPVQMAMALSTFINGGYSYKPYILMGNQHPASEMISLKPDTVRIVNEALSAVVNGPNGTAKGARSHITTIGGKTGTAQVVSKKRAGSGEKFMDHAWFVAFAPVDNPEIALSVFVEHGGGGGAVAAPIAKKAIEAYIKSKEQQHSRTAEQHNSRTVEQ